MIEIVATGPLATVQDLGRPGYAALGVPASGAFDRAALRLANRLVGNGEGAAAIEVTLGGLVVRLVDAATIALTGALCPDAPDWGAARSAPAGTMLRLGTPKVGLRSYLAIRGGIGIDPVLGSRSTDTLSGLGPAPLRIGDVLPVGTATGEVSGAAAPGSNGGTPVLAIRFGPRDDWFTAVAHSRLVDTEWMVRSDSDRVGLRLDGLALERSGTGELPSEPMLPGALQVPPDGRPILFGPDAPVTGGYPVIAVVTELDKAAQLRPGDVVRFSRRTGS
jgi:biotin-dependent carboxylase-like uncharacterized protein